MNRRNIEIVTIDELALYAEEDLAERINTCRSEMGKRQHDVSWRLSWENELSYAQRELQVRQSRRRSHQDFIVREAEAIATENAREAWFPEYDGNRIPRFVREAYEWN